MRDRLCGWAQPGLRPSLSRRDQHPSNCDDADWAGLVKSISQPGGSATGVSFASVELVVKQLDLMGEMLPHLARVAPSRDVNLRQASVAAEHAKRLGDIYAAAEVLIQYSTCVALRLICVPNTRSQNGVVTPKFPASR